MKKTIKAISLLLPLLLLFSQCNKIELPPDTEDDPVFDVELKESGSVLGSFTAGLDNYRLYTSYEQGVDSVWTFIGEFKKEDGTANNSPSLRFEIRDIEVNSSVNIEEALMQSPYGFYNTNFPIIIDTAFRAQFSALTMGCPQGLPAEAFVWNFGDNSSEETGHTATHLYENTDNRDVQLKINYGNNQETFIQQTLTFDTLPHCSVQLNVVQGGTYLFATGSGIAPYSYQWNDGTNGNSMFIDTVNVDYSITMTDASGCVVIANGPIDLNGICTAQFTYNAFTAIDTSVVMLSQYSTITIIYVDENGETFRSDSDEQQNTSFFTIEEVEDFKKNERGEQTKKLTVSFLCELFSDNNSSITVENTNGIIGIAYPD